MMEGVAARLLCWQRGLTGWHEARQLVYSHTGESQELGRAGPQARAGSTSQRGGLLASEASWTINRDKLKYMAGIQDRKIFQHRFSLPPHACTAWTTPRSGKATSQSFASQDKGYRSWRPERKRELVASFPPYSGCSQGAGERLQGQTQVVRSEKRAAGRGTLALRHAPERQGVWPACA